jgi:hypothetical protein
MTPVSVRLMHVIALVVDPQSEDREEQDHCGDDDHDFHAVRIRPGGSAAISESARPRSA